MMTRVLSVYREEGLSGVLSRTRNRVLAEFLMLRSRIFVRRAKCFSMCKKAFANRVGLELGGPSRIFGRRNVLPLYTIVKRLDNCNFSGKTIWQGEIREGMVFHFDKKHNPGRQFILDATDLKGIQSETYEFVIASHIIEHIANPLKALLEWKRVIKIEGHLLLVVPHKEGTFDHKRPLTSLEHLVDDFNQGTKENDQNHLLEILELHDLDRDATINNYKAFKERAEHNPENRSLHQHVFDTALVCSLLNYVNLQLNLVEGILPYHIIVMAKKLPFGQLPDNRRFIGNRAEFRYKTPFLSDRVCAS